MLKTTTQQQQLQDERTKLHSEHAATQCEWRPHKCLFPSDVRETPAHISLLMEASQTMTAACRLLTFTLCWLHCFVLFWFYLVVDVPLPERRRRPPPDQQKEATARSDQTGSSQSFPPANNQVQSSGSFTRPRAELRQWAPRGSSAERITAHNNRYHQVAAKDMACVSTCDIIIHRHVDAVISLCKGAARRSSQRRQRRLAHCRPEIQFHRSRSS